MTNVAHDSIPLETRDESGINPRTGRTAGNLQASVLLAGSCLPVLGTVLLAPVLPDLAREFRDTPGSEALVPLVLTAPALFIALLAPFAGNMIDRFGRRKALISALLFYAVLGVLPMLLDALVPILVSRIAVGIAEAVIMTCCTTLIADYFIGSKRNRYLGLQALITSLAGTIFLAVGGALGVLGWRAPFAAYSISLLIALFAAVAIWQIQPTERTVRKNPLTPLNWRRLGPVILVTFIGGIVFYSFIVELPFLLATAGVSSPAEIGLGSVIASLGMALGALLFPVLARRWTTKTLLPVALSIAGLGLIAAPFMLNPAQIVASATFASFGTGLLLPTLITWALMPLSYDQRGRGTGIWTAAIFFGEFLCPIIMVALTAITGSLAASIAWVGCASLILAVICGAGLRRSTLSPIPDAAYAAQQEA